MPPIVVKYPGLVIQQDHIDGPLEYRGLCGLLSPIFHQLLANALPLGLGQIIDKQLAVQVIYFMLNTNSQQAVRFLFGNI